VGSDRNEIVAGTDRVAQLIDKLAQAGQLGCGVIRRHPALTAYATAGACQIPRQTPCSRAIRLNGSWHPHGEVFVQMPSANRPHATVLHG
jgi:hypothetical protein